MIQSVLHDPIFEFDVLQVDVACWVDIGLPATHAVRHRWPHADGDGSTRMGMWAARLPSA